MPEDYYPNDSEMAGGHDESKPHDDSKDSEEPEETTALIPKSLLAGKQFKPGEEVIFKIVHEYEDEVEIAYATGEKKENKSSTMEAADSQMDEMASKNSDNPGY